MIIIDAIISYKIYAKVFGLFFLSAWYLAPTHGGQNLFRACWLVRSVDKQNMAFLLASNAKLKIASHTFGFQDLRMSFDICTTGFVTTLVSSA